MRRSARPTKQPQLFTFQDDHEKIKIKKLEHEHEDDAYIQEEEEIVSEHDINESSDESSVEGMYSKVSAKKRLQVDVSTAAKTTGISAKKATPVKKRQKSDISRQPKSGNVIFDVLRQSVNDMKDSNIRALVDAWLEEYATNAVKAMNNLVNFILYTAGAEHQYITDDYNFEDVDEDDLDDMINDIAKALVTDEAIDNNKYPLKDPKFHVCYSKFWTIFVESLLRMMSETDYHERSEGNHIMFSVIDRVVNLSCMAVSTVRDVVTDAAISMGKTLLYGCKDLHSKLEATNRQISTQDKIASSSSSSKLQTVTMRKVRYEAALESLSEGAKIIFQSFFVHRLRDTSAFIRSLCSKHIGEWLTIYPSQWFKDEYLKYLGWMTTDYDAQTRHDAISSIEQLLACEEYAGALNKFIGRFIGRFVEIVAHDSDYDVSLKMIKVLRLIQSRGLLNNVSESTIDLVDACIFNSNTPEGIRLEVFQFFADHAAGFEAVEDTILPDATIIVTNSGRKDKKKGTSEAAQASLRDRQRHITQLQTLAEFANYHLKSEYEKVDLLASVCLQSNRGGILQDWPAMASLLLKDTDDPMSADLDESLSIYLLRMLVISVKHVVRGTQQDVDDKGTYRKVASVHYESLIQQLHKDYTKLVNRFRDDDTSLSVALELLPFCDVSSPKEGLTFLKSTLKMTAEIFNSSIDYSIKIAIVDAFKHWLSTDSGEVHRLTVGTLATMYTKTKEDINVSLIIEEKAIESMLIPVERYTVLLKKFDLHGLIGETPSGQGMGLMIKVTERTMELYAQSINQSEIEVETERMYLAIWNNSVFAVNSMVAWLSLKAINTGNDDALFDATKTLCKEAIYEHGCFLVENLHQLIDTGAISEACKKDAYTLMSHAIEEIRSTSALLALVSKRHNGEASLVHLSDSVQDIIDTIARGQDGQLAEQEDEKDADDIDDDVSDRSY